jgi:glutaminyl-tRNA synthetase
MKQDLNNPNPQMWDLVAYRVLNALHHRTGDKWKIYPTYDFTHCLVDSFENISHSLCTTEFYLSRESYEWLCDAVEVYRPQQREYGRLNITGTIMSKRKILKLVNEGIVRDWDDPRLFTLVAIKRRGIPPGAILSFVAELGVTTSNSNIQVNRFENSIRKYLEDHTPRLMMILDPVLVIIDNLPDDHYEEISMPFKPGTPEMGEHKVSFTKRVYVDRSDFREVAESNYFRLTPGQPVGLLRVPHNIRVTSFKKDESTGLVTEIHAHYENDIPFKKPKTFIQWIADAPRANSPIRISEVRLFNQLFKSENPSGHPDGFMADINPDSETVLKNAIVETGFSEVKARSPWVIGENSDDLRGKEKAGAPESVRFQALRVGYFCMDKDSTEDKMVLNRIVTLKEDASKN